MKRTVSLVYCFCKTKMKEIFNFKPFLGKSYVITHQDRENLLVFMIS